LITGLGFRVSRLGFSAAGGGPARATADRTTDRAIDALVYELYELTEEEIKVLEG